MKKLFFKNLVALTFQKMIIEKKIMKKFFFQINNFQENFDTKMFNEIWKIKF